MRSTRLNIAVVAPIPSASVITTTAANPGLLRNWRKEKRMSWVNPFMNNPLISVSSLISQCHHRIDLCRAPRWDVAGKQRCPNEEQRHAAESQRICRRHAKEQRLHGACQCQRTAKPNADTNEDRAQSLAQDHLQNVTIARAQCHTHANIVRAAADRIGHHAKHPCRCE